MRMVEYFKYIACAAVIAYFVSCETNITSEPFYDEIDISIAEYITEQQDTFTKFYEVVKTSGLEKTLSAYNYHGTQYTVFMPTDEAFERFIEQNDRYSSFQEFINDKEYLLALSKYHIVNMGINTNDFPFGALPDTTVSGDFLTIGFSEMLDSTIYKVNNYAAVTRGNIELTNGYIHVIDEVLIPVVFNHYEWLNQNNEYSVFSRALEITGLIDTFKVYIEDEQSKQTSNTLLVEPNSVYNKAGIFSIDDLINLYSPDSENYTSKLNGLYNYVAYHILEGKHFLNDFEGQSTNFNTYGNLPISISAGGIDIKINAGVANFDTIIENNDTTIINFVKIDYENSNVITKNGPIHFVENVLEVYKPKRTTRTFEFFEEPLINDASKNPNTYEFDEPEDFVRINWQGTEFLRYVKYSNNVSGLWSNDYLEIEGDFSISYIIPKVLPGKYAFRIRTNANYYNNATVQVYFDGRKIGGNIDLSSGGTGDQPYNDFIIGYLNFDRYEQHEVTLRTLIPGTLTWDNVSFVPE